MMRTAIVAYRQHKFDEPGPEGGCDAFGPVGGLDAAHVVTVRALHPCPSRHHCEALFELIVRRITTVPCRGECRQVVETAIRE